MNIKKFTCFFSILFSIICSNCLAVSKWTFIQQDNQGQATYVDNFGKKKSGNMIILWLLQDYKKAKQENNKRLLKLISFDALNKNIDKQNTRKRRKLFPKIYCEM